MAFEDFKPEMKGLTSDEVLEIIRMDAVRADDLGLNHLPDRDWTIKRLRRLYGATDWPTLGKQLNQQFGLKRSRSMWRRLLTPERRRTIGDLCDSIATEARIPTIEPLAIAGANCLPAGAFLVIREILREAGADVSELRPSSRLAPYLCRFPHVIVRFRHLAGDSFPSPVFEAPIHWGLYGAMLASDAILFSSHYLHIGLAWSNWSAISMVFCWIALALANKCLRPAAVHLGWMRTFRDLSRVLAGELPGHLRGFDVVARDSSG